MMFLLLRTHSLPLGSPSPGGTFNPLHEAGFAGPLAHEVKNEHGCDAFEKRYEGAVVVVKRGKCWFHEKSIRAQEAGAIGLIIANDNRPMADIMEGVESLPAPYIISVLVERDVGLKMLGTSSRCSWGEMSGDEMPSFFS